MHRISFLERTTQLTRRYRGEILVGVLVYAALVLRDLLAVLLH